MLRFYVTIIFHLHLVIYYTIQMKRYIKNKKYNVNDRYQYGRKIVKKITKLGRITVKTFGLENLPRENGYVMYSNHQGKYDALSIIVDSERPLSVVIDKKVVNNVMLKSFLTLLNSKALDKTNFRKGIELFHQIEEEIKNGSNYLIFPEGKYTDNKNNLQEFHTGCMRFLQNTKCPVVPITLFNTYKVYGINSLKKVSCEVHYLKPIYYEEYKDLNKNEIADLIKSRIQNKLDELKNHLL